MLIGRFRPTERLAPCYPTYRITTPRSRYTSPRGILPSCCTPLTAAALCPADRQQAAGPEEEAEGDVRRRAGAGHGRPHQGVVHAHHQEGV